MLAQRILKTLKCGFSMKDDIKKRMAEFVTVDTGGVLRSQPTTKERKYKNIEIASDFKKIDEKRKRERLENIKRRQLLLQKRINDEKKLLTEGETNLIKEELNEIKQTLQKEDQEIYNLTKMIDDNEAEYILIEGFWKMTVINRIKYLHYLHSHNPGFTLHPETIKAIENVHYCVNHNLPVNRIALYEMMPEYFQAEIGELQESVQRLIMEKNISQDDENSTSTIRYFHKLTLQENLGSGPHLITEQIQETFNNVFDHCGQILLKHGPLLERISKGYTPFRNLDHMFYVMLSDMDIKYLPEEQALRQDLFQIAEIKQEWVAYKEEKLKEMNDIKHNYVDPPPYIANHPVLMDRWETMMISYTNPVTKEEAGLLQTGDLSEARLAQKIRQEIQKVVREKYDPLFVEAMNNDRSKIDKKQLEIDFYKLSTNVYENLNALEDKSSQEEIFKKVEKKQNKFLLQQRKKNLIKLDHLTRIIFLNNKNKDKYNAKFFSAWLGVEEGELRNLLRSVSYLRVPQQKEKDEAKDVKYQILKFQE